MCAKWSCHTWIAVQQFLVKNQIQTIHQPPYSPDLAPCNFRISQDTRLGSKGYCLVSSEEIKENTTAALTAVPKVDLQGGFQEDQDR